MPVLISVEFPLPARDTAAHPIRETRASGGALQQGGASSRPAAVSEESAAVLLSCGAKRLSPSAPARPSEPILVPKLRIGFADFPYLHLSMRPEAVHLGDLLRISVRPSTKINQLTRLFKGRPKSTGHRVRRGAFRKLRPYLRLNRGPGTRSLNKKRQLSPGLWSASPSSFALPLSGHSLRRTPSLRV